MTHPTQNNTGGDAAATPIGAAWMREQAANTVAYSERLISEDNRIWIDERPYVCEETAYRAIRAIPLPTDADLLAEAMKLPEVAALLNTLETLRREAWGYNINYETAFHAEVYDTLKDALATFTAPKETP